jgi:hypothetical protein
METQKNLSSKGNPEQKEQCWTNYNTCNLFHGTGIKADV